MTYVINEDEREQLSTQWAMNKSLGFGNAPVILAAGETSTAGDTFFAVQVVTEAVFSAWKITDSTGIASLLGPAIAAGMVIYGLSSDITVTSGVVICYKRLA